MGIVVVNISKNYARTGPQDYEVRLNQIKLAQFTHVSEDGMAQCMRLAAEALEKLGDDGISRLVEQARLRHLQVMMDMHEEGFTEPEVKTLLTRQKQRRICQKD